MPLRYAELDATVDQEGVDFIRYDGDEIAQELRCFQLAVFGQRLGISRGMLDCSVYRQSSGDSNII